MRKYNRLCWNFSVEEVSCGVYLAVGTDSAGRHFDQTGIDPHQRGNSKRLSATLTLNGRTPEEPHDKRCPSNGSSYLAHIAWHLTKAGGDSHAPRFAGRSAGSVNTPRIYRLPPTSKTNESFSNKGHN
jgi:hypothetical protein